jgi:hypothetical protein
MHPYYTVQPERHENPEGDPIVRSTWRHKSFVGGENKPSSKDLVRTSFLSRIITVCVAWIAGQNFVKCAFKFAHPALQYGLPRHLVSVKKHRRKKIESHEHIIPEEHAPRGTGSAFSSLVMNFSATMYGHLDEVSLPAARSTNLRRFPALPGNNFHKRSTWS